MSLKPVDEEMNRNRKESITLYYYIIDISSVYRS